MNKGCNDIKPGNMSKLSVIAFSALEKHKYCEDGFVVDAPNPSIDVVALFSDL